jgi:glycosyltransferase involved in cell wall biosynthesis
MQADEHIHGDTAVIIAAKDEQDRIAATVEAAASLPGVDLVVVVDDGSTDATGRLAAGGGAKVIRHSRNRGKGAAMETGAAVVRLLDGDVPRHLLFLDADLGETAKLAGPLVEPVRAGTAAMTIAVFSDLVKLGGHGFVVRLSRDGIRRLTGWTATQPLNGQRCLTRAAFDAAQPLAPGFGVETGLTVDLLRKGFPIEEVEVPLSHRATGTDWRSQLHRGRQFRDVARALAVREPTVARQLTRLRHGTR